MGSRVGPSRWPGAVRVAASGWEGLEEWQKVGPRAGGEAGPQEGLGVKLGLGSGPPLTAFGSWGVRRGHGSELAGVRLNLKPLSGFQAPNVL